MMKEIWLDIRGYKGLYKISNLGNIKSIKKGKNLLLSKISVSDGYHGVRLYKNLNNRSIGVHRLVAQAFIENPDNKPQVNHKNGIKIDNRVKNLERCTIKENCNHAVKNNLYSHYKRPVIQLDMNGNFIKERKSVLEAKQSLGLSSHICSCCLGRRNSHGGYKRKHKFIT